MLTSVAITTHYEEVGHDVFIGIINACMISAVCLQEKKRSRPSLPAVVKQVVAFAVWLVRNWECKLRKQ